MIQTSFMVSWFISINFDGMVNVFKQINSIFISFFHIQFDIILVRVLILGSSVDV